MVPILQAGVDNSPRPPGLAEEQAQWVPVAFLGWQTESRDGILVCGGTLRTNLRFSLKLEAVQGMRCQAPRVSAIIRDSSAIHIVNVTCKIII